MLSVNVLVHHGDAYNDGQNLAETVLTPTNVNSTDFGKLFTTALDGAIYAQPLYVQNVNITRGSSLGVHSVLYIATLHDSLYALDASTGAVLWQDSFLDITDPTALTVTSGVTTVPSSEIGSDLGAELGILSTPAINLGLSALFLTANTQEIRGSDTHFVQRLWAVNLSSGAAIGSPAMIGDTISNGAFESFTGYKFVAGPIVNGSGNNTSPTTYPNTDGWVSAPGGATGPVIAFNALLQMGRTSLTLMGGNVYLGFASHGDNGPYYGWVLGYSESSLALTAAFVTTPTYEGIVGDRTDYTAQGGLWTSGSAFATDGSNLYITTGNGAFNAAPSNFNAQGFPIDHDYGDSLIKLTADPGSTSSSQNGNGWGLKVADYFTPSNELAMNQLDLDFGSGGVLLLPESMTDAAGNPMLMTGGKESRLYLIDRDNLGKFNTSYPATGNPDPRLYDRVLGEYASDGINGGSDGLYGTPSYYNGNIYAGLTNIPLLEFDAATFASPTVPPGTAYTPTPAVQGPLWGYPSATFTISANGSSNGVAWGTHDSSNDLVAFNATNITTPIYDSNTNSADTFTNPEKFGVPTVANGMAYVTTTGGAVVGFGLHSSYLTSNSAFFGAPTNLSASFVSAADVQLSWTSKSSLATEFRIDRSTNGSSWSTLAFVGNSATSYDDTTTAGTGYYYRVIAVSGASSTVASNTAAVTALALAGAGFYLEVDADRVHLDIWTNSDATGSPADRPLLAALSSLSLTATAIGSLTVDASNGNPLPTAGVTFTGFGDSTYNGIGVTGTPAGNDTLTAAVGQIIFDGRTIKFSDVSNQLFVPGSGTDSVTANGVTLALGTSSDSGAATYNFSSLTIGAGGRLNIAERVPPYSHRILVDTNSLTNNGTLDLDGNDLEVITGNLATITSEIANGTGIVSSVTSALTRLGVLANTSIFGSGPLGQFDGTNPPTNAILVKYTYAGDANLDGQVDGSDYTLIDNGFNNGLTGWLNGDFNYDGKVDGSDYTLIDNAFENQGASLAPLTAKPAVANSYGTAAIALASSDFFDDRRRLKHAGTEDDTDRQRRFVLEAISFR
jgi:hypothetical protein